MSHFGYNLVFLRGYTRLRGSREAVTGAKSTCSGEYKPCFQLPSFLQIDMMLEIDWRHVPLLMTLQNGTFPLDSLQNPPLRITQMNWLILNNLPPVPPSDASDTDDHDSVHSLPVGSTRKREKEARSVSSGHTPQASAFTFSLDIFLSCFFKNSLENIFLNSLEDPHMLQLWTLQASYADIARHAAALYTQQVQISIYISLI